MIFFIKELSRPRKIVLVTSSNGIGQTTCPSRAYVVEDDIPGSLGFRFGLLSAHHENVIVSRIRSRIITTNYPHLPPLGAKPELTMRRRGEFIARSIAGS